MQEKEENQEKQGGKTKHSKFFFDTPDERKPREKLLKSGAKSLENRDLIAILLGTGTAEQNVMMVADNILNTFDNRLHKIADAPPQELIDKIKGLGKAKTVTLLAALELGRRQQAERIEQTPLQTDKDLYELFKYDIEFLDHEEIHVACLNANNVLISKTCISSGGWTASALDIRQLMKFLLTSNAIKFVLAHNHPSGTTTPSRQDDMMTDKINRAAQIMGLVFEDHIVIGRGSDYYSYRKNGKL